MAKEKPTEEQSENKSQKPAGVDSEAGKNMAKKVTANLVILTIVLTVIISGLGAIGLSYVAAVLVIGLLPGIMSNVIDRRPGRFASRTVVAFNIAGIFPQVVTMFMRGNPNVIAQEMISNPFTWLWVYLFAAFGWVIVHLVPQITFLFLNIKAEYSIKRMRSIQKDLEEEWGADVKGARG